MGIRERILALLGEIGRGVYEKETELRLGMLAALAGESMILLGPPGVAKSMVARRLKDAFAGARSFEYLMSRFSTPDDIFGPVSISRLKENDTYERVIDGYLPTADVVFLDEIWKAGPAIQNTLLTALNEKIFRNGNSEVALPLKLLVAASNELPAEGEGLDALWDRFLVRYISHGVKDNNAFFSMIFDTDEVYSPAKPEQLQITAAEYDSWRKEIAAVGVDDSVKECILYIRERLRNITDKESGAVYGIYVSDRRWKKAVNLLRASAFVHGRSVANLSDIAVLAYCLWNEPAECGVVREAVIDSLFAAVNRRHALLQQRVEKAVRLKRAAAALAESKMQARPEDANLILFDDFYYRLSTYNTGNTYIFASDFHRLPNITERTPASGHLYTDSTDAVKQRIRAFGATNYNDGEKVRLMRDREFLYVNGVRCELERYTASEMAALNSRQGNLFNADGYDYETEVEQIATALNGMNSSLADNIFIASADVEQMRSVASGIMKRIALTRADISELLYD